MGKLKFAVGGMSPGEVQSGTIRINNGQDVGPLNIMVSPNRHGFFWGGSVTMLSVGKTINDNGATYYLSYRNDTGALINVSYEASWV